MGESCQKGSNFSQGDCRGRSKEMADICATSTEKLKVRLDDDNPFFSSGKLNHVVSAREEPHAIVGDDYPKRQQWSPEDSRYDGVGETPLGCSSSDRADEEATGNVQILLRGLDSPTRIAAISGKTNNVRGVLFVHSATVSSQDSHRIVGSCRMTVNGSSAKNLSFLALGAQTEVTVLERLCNPIAICVASDGNVLVLEEVGQREANNVTGHQEVEQDKPCRRKCRYRVRYLYHVELNAFLESQRARSDNCDGQDGGQGNKCASSQYVERTSEDDTQSETDWEDNVSTPISDYFYRTTTNAKPENGIGRCRGRRKTLEPKHAFELPLPPKGGPVEQPVDMCVLADGTVVIAFCRLAPLHEGTAVAESQGIIRAFPPSQITRDRRHGSIGSGSVVVGATKSEKCTSPSDVDTDGGYDCQQSSPYDPGEQWVIAEGLPVITRVVASGGEGGGVYVSLCGSGYDGAVVAIGSLSTRQTVSATGVRIGALVQGIAGVRQPKPLMSTELHPRRLSKGSVERNRADSFVPIVSGYAAALAVDGNNNL